VVSIKAEDIEKQPINNPLYALQGRVAGLVVTPTTGLAGGAVNLQIRGQNSLNPGGTPLIVIDGLPVVNNIQGLGHLGLLQLSALSFINPNEIESISVLKDADATSVYGSRGANGVILITTKKGKIGQTKIDVNIQNGWANVAKKVKLLNTSEYLRLRREGYANAGIDFINTFPFGNPAYTSLVAQDLFLWDTTRYTDWQKELIGGTARYQDIQGSISGGTPTLQYLIGGNYHKETTVFPGDNSDQKGSVHMGLTGGTLNQKFSATVTASYMTDHNTLPGSDFTRQAVTLSPDAPAPYTSEGSLNWAIGPTGVRSWDNPYADLFKLYDGKVNNLVGSASIQYKLFPFLTLKAQAGYNELKGASFRMVAPFAGRSPEEMNGFASSNFNTSSVKSQSFEPQINYHSQINKGVIDLLVGGAIQNTITEDQLLNASGFTSDALLRNLASATNITGSNTSSQYRYCALFSRLSYNWENKYLLNLSARRDGSSRFGPGNQFGNFGSLGIAWIFTQEPFIRSNIPFISYGKFRFSYGSSGNDGIGDYQYLERYQPVTGLDPYLGATGYRTTGLFNSYYAWEVTRKMEWGLETGFLKDRILFSTSYFRNRSGNQLLGYPLPSMAGPGRLLYNLPALIQNTGIEFTLNTENIKSKYFSWSTSINFTRNRNKLLAYPNLTNSPYYVNNDIGQPFTGISKVYNYAGVDPVSGKYQFKDSQGKITLTPEDPSRLDGGKYLRVMLDPQFYGGFSNTFTYKGISLEILFQFVKRNGVNPLSTYLFSAGYSKNNLPIDFLNRWQKQGDVAEIQKVYGVTNNSLREATNRVLQSNLIYVDASFIRLKNISLSYSIPLLWSRKMHLQNLRVYFQGQNLWTFTKYKGLDPETQSMGSLPPLRVLTAGVNITF
jgi:TonB-linked SusC/RagA family outer membrane protein